MEKRPAHHTIITILTCAIIISLPFITLITCLGADTFLDSYRHPNQFTYRKNTAPNPLDTNAAYLITEDATPTTLHQGDTILYRTLDGIQTGTISALATSHGTLVCLVASNTNDTIIHPWDIVGRITATLHDDPWTLLTLHLWDLTTHTLNPCALLNL
jgi:hypothetical protein